MAKIKVSGNTISGTAEDLTNAFKKVADKINSSEITIEIKAAKLKDAFCNYSYELTAGPTAGDTCNRNGGSIIHDDMIIAFNKLDVHLAVICEEIEVKKILDIDSIERYNEDDHDEKSIEFKVSHFNVSAFSLDGTGEKESVQLVGEKRLSTGDYVQLKTPKIPWSGDYAFINELRVVIDDLKEEVEAYMNGKTAPKMVQQEMEFDEAEKIEGE